MTASLTPALALAYLREISLDVREAVVLDAAGEPIVGARTLAARARRLLSGGDAPSVTDGALHAARTPDGGAIAVLAGDLALVPLLEHDLGTVAQALATRRSGLPGT
jgi:hypothetical protein